MREIKLDLSTSEINQVGSVIVRQDDDNSQKVIARILEDGNLKDLRNITVFFNAMIDDTTVARDLAHIDQAQSTVSYVLKAPFFQRTGRITGYFSFEKGTSRESTADFYYTVIKGATRCIKQGSYIFEFEQLKDKIGGIIGNGDLLPLLKEINELNSKIDGHVINKANPHGVTASQVGAYTKKEATDETKKIIKGYNIKHKTIFDGGADDGRYFGSDVSYNYNLSSNQEFHSLKLIWSRHNDEGDDKVNNFGYYTFDYTSENFKNGSYYLPMHLTTGDLAVKRVYVKEDSVSGHEINYDKKENKLFKLRKAIVYYREVI